MSTIETGSARDTTASSEALVCHVTAAASDLPAEPGAPRTARIWWFASLLVLCNLIWATQPTAVKKIGEQLGPIAITFLPFYVTTLLLIPLLVWTRRRNPQAVRPAPRDWWQFVVAGVGGQVVAQLCGVWALTKPVTSGSAVPPASNCAILMLLIPVVTAGLASLMLRERLTFLRIVCLLVGLAGVMLMSVQDLRQASFLKTGYFLGNLLLLASCIGSAFFNVYCKKLLIRFSEVEVLIFSYITASLASAGALYRYEPDCLHRLAHLNGVGWAALIFLAIFMYGVSALLLFHVLQHLPVTVASASIYLCPVFGVIIAAVFLNERLTGWQLAGAAAVLVPTVLIMRYDTAG